MRNWCASRRSLVVRSIATILKVGVQNNGDFLFVSPLVAIWGVYTAENKLVESKKNVINNTVIMWYLLCLKVSC